VAEERLLYFCLSTDCEASQPAVDDPALGARASEGLAEILEARGWPGSFYVIPGDLEAAPDLYRDLEQRGHEIGLHLHPAALGAQEFGGVYGPEEQRALLAGASARFEAVLGRDPSSFCMGYYSTNDYTYPLLVKLGFTHGRCSHPGRILPQCASVWAGAPLFPHYAHPYNRVLPGDLDFVEVPATIDWESRMWGGAHPQDLRVELVDAKNHFYTMEKSLRRQREEAQPLLLLHAVTHNTFDYSASHDFRRETLLGIMAHAEALAEKHGYDLQGATTEELATRYREMVPREPLALELDRRGYLEDK
jgi:peptidoglycan/xylan/chitin deacetylase (PgdA/CDA1 family)